MDISSLLKQGQNILTEAGLEEADLDAWLLLEYVTGISRAHYYANREEEIPKETEDNYFRLISERKNHIPLQHITHQAFFMGYEFYVDERVLIPRQDTEILTEEGIKFIKKMHNPQVLDLCTGSGCIAVSLALEVPDASVTAVDISPDALAVAKRNAELQKAGVHFIESNLFQSDEIFGSYDMIISNPPYIPTEEISNLMEEVRLHDPILALDGTEDGLYFYREIIKRAPEYLNHGGALLFEIGYDQGTAVCTYMMERGFSDVRIIQDLSGLDRVVTGKWK